jgi:hypothetical protein
MESSIVEIRVTTYRSDHRHGGTDRREKKEKPGLNEPVESEKKTTKMMQAYWVGT